MLRLYNNCKAVAAEFARNDSQPLTGGSTPLAVPSVNSWQANRIDRSGSRTWDSELCSESRQDVVS